ncbi:MAG: hypothetical protein M1826_000919 [Phylliscum demangeonii]|nr:MAG: hypothetical protein M1826_000919 [Phylliscum demangeonii]
MAEAEPTDDYDHQILLLDGPSAVDQSDSGSLISPVDSVVGRTSTNLSRKWTLREELARRKHAKWQERRLEDNVGASQSDAARTTSPKDVYEVDVLYENQRGSFLCGIPLFSRKTLLNLDPSPWTNAAFKDSPVDTTTAQLPDPTWAWVWQSWYVDMSADVDADGWQYSFAFSPSFSWHGTHPWFHSFVRRRRWLRKRVKRRRPHLARLGSDTDRQMMHADAEQNKRSVVDPVSPGRQNYGGGLGGLVTDPRDSIHHIKTMMSVLKSGRIDREKVEAVMNFLDNGGGELAFLAEEMPEIMSSFVFQESRRQLLVGLQRRFDALAKETKDGLGGAAEIDNQRYEGMLRAVQAADEHVRGLEYWSDIKEMVQSGDTSAGIDPKRGWASHKWHGIDSSGPASDSLGHGDLQGQEEQTAQKSEKLESA